MDFRPPPRSQYRQHRPAPKQPIDLSQPGQAPAARVRRSIKAGTRFWLAGLAVIVILLLAFLTYGYLHTRNQLKQLSSSSSAQTESEAIISKVSKLIEVPTGEKPSLYTVKDVSKLKGQPFYEHTQNGDKVLFYAKAGRAIIYRPSTNRIVEYAHLNTSPQ